MFFFLIKIVLSEIWRNFSHRIAQLVEFTLKLQQFPNCFVKGQENFVPKEKKKTLGPAFFCYLDFSVIFCLDFFTLVLQLHLHSLRLLELCVLFFKN